MINYSTPFITPCCTYLVTMDSGELSPPFAKSESRCRLNYLHTSEIYRYRYFIDQKKHGPRKALMTYMYRWHKCQFTRSHIIRLYHNNKTLLSTSTRICIIIYDIFLISFYINALKHVYLLAP